jgi:hypothetical protein
MSDEPQLASQHELYIIIIIIIDYNELERIRRKFAAFCSKRFYQCVDITTIVHLKN